jgi:carbamate kinase
MRLVVALGGNALLRRGESPDDDVQQENLRGAVQSIAPLARDHQLVVVHGNGPHVGLLATRPAGAHGQGPHHPLDALVAETQGMIGYWLARALGSALPHHDVVAVLTQTLVAADDPAFADPTKFIGPGMDAETARRLSAEHGWRMKLDGADWRRVVPSPEPQAILELPTVRALVEADAVVIAGGGGGVPVTRDSSGRRQGLEAVVDKDLVAAALATGIGAEALVLLTDVPAVQRGFGTPHASAVHEATAEELHDLALPPGSMGPKVEACRRFLREGGGTAAIGSVDHTADVLAGRAGTRILPSGRPRRRVGTSP